MDTTLAQLALGVLCEVCSGQENQQHDSADKASEPRSPTGTNASSAGSCARRISALSYNTRCSRLCRPQLRRALCHSSPKAKAMGCFRHYANPRSCNPPDQAPAPAVPKAVQERILRGEFVDCSSKFVA